MHAAGSPDVQLFGPRLPRVAADLRSAGLLARHPRCSAPDAALHYCGPRDCPAADVTLRAIDDARIDIVAEGSGQACYDSISLHRGRLVVLDAVWYGLKVAPSSCVWSLPVTPQRAGPSSHPPHAHCSCTLRPAPRCPQHMHTASYAHHHAALSITCLHTGQVLESVELSTAFFHVYDGAVYMAQGRTYLCKV